MNLHEHLFSVSIADLGIGISQALDLTNLENLHEEQYDSKYQGIFKQNRRMCIQIIYRYPLNKYELRSYIDIP